MQAETSLAPPVETRLEWARTCRIGLGWRVAVSQQVEELKAMQVQVLRDQGLAQADVDTALAATAAAQTPLMNAISGVIGTVVTAVLVSAVAAAFWRRRRVSSV